MIEFHYRGLRVAVDKVESVMDRESGVMINGAFCVDESYDEVMAKVNGCQITGTLDSTVVTLTTITGGYEHGFAHAREFIERYGLERAEGAYRGPDDIGHWHRGFRHGVEYYKHNQGVEEVYFQELSAKEGTTRPGFATGGVVKELDSAELEPMYMDPLTGEVEAENYWLGHGYTLTALAQVTPDGNGGWTPVE